VTPIPNIKSDEPLSIILSPHYDDAVFALGGMLAQYRLRHDESYVLTLFGGQAPASQELTWWNKETGFESNAQAEEARIMENRNALSLLGLDNDHMLDSLLDDVQYRNDRDPGGEARIAKAVGDEIKAVLSRFSSRTISIFSPISTAWGRFWEDSHPDHAIVHEAFLNIFRKAQHPAVSFYLYEDVIPYVYRFGHDNAKNWVEENDRVRLEQVIIELTERDFSSKLAALSQYKSQMRQFREPVDATLIGYSSRLCSALGRSCHACEVVYRMKPENS